MTDTYTEDPTEIAPCLVCGKPKRNDEPCYCLAPRTEVTITFVLKAVEAEVLEGAERVHNMLIDALIDGLPDEWWQPTEDGWFLDYLREGR
jgi:hypothetical protein